jgi:hypothetical protein
MCTNWKSILYLLTADTLDPLYSDMKHTKLVLPLQETFRYRWVAHSIYIHIRETAYNSQHTSKHDHSLRISS